MVTRASHRPVVGGPRGLGPGRAPPGYENDTTSNSDLPAPRGPSAGADLPRHEALGPDVPNRWCFVSAYCVSQGCRGGTGPRRCALASRHPVAVPTAAFIASRRTRHLSRPRGGAL